jgi:hypothetical protein
MFGPLKSAATQPNHCSGKADPSTSAIQARMFFSTTIYLFEGIVRQRGGEGLDAKVRELTIIALVSLLSLGLAWAYEADFFAMFFAAAAAMAGVEAVRRSL